MTKLKNSNCVNSLNFDKPHKQEMWKTQKLKLWQNSKTQIGTKLRKSNRKQTQQPKKNLAESFLVITTWHLDHQWNVFEAAFCILAMFFFGSWTNKYFKPWTIRYPLYKFDHSAPFAYLGPNEPYDHLGPLGPFVHLAPLGPFANLRPLVTLCIPWTTRYPMISLDH